MLKRVVLLKAVLFFTISAIAQDKDDLIIRTEIGILDLSETGSFGLFLHVEPKLRSSENTVIGLRLGVTLNSETIENTNSTLFSINDDSDNGVISVVPTFDYYWNEHKLRPSIGMGVGAYLLGSYIDVSRRGTPDHAAGDFKVNLKYQVGVLLRGGVILGKSRLGLEYNFIPKSDLQLTDGQKIGTVDLSYLGLSIGFKIGGWRI